MRKSVATKLLGLITAIGIASASLLSPQTAISTNAAEVATGIDVAKYQGSINWSQVAASGVKFAFVRAGSTVGGQDEQFVNNITGANAAGLRVGVYYYTSAKTAEQAAAEATQVLQWIAPYTVSFPVALDIESPSLSGLSTQELNAIINAFCNVINGSGYHPIVYSSRNWFVNKIGDITWDKWIAMYSSALDYTGSYAIWQSSSQGSYSGIGTRVDVNHLYKDYFSLIPQQGLIARDNQTYLYCNYRRVSGWGVVDGSRYYCNADGVVQSGWFNDGVNNYYLNPDNGGAAAIGFADIGGIRYYFDENAVMRTGILVVNGQTFYADASGACQKGFVTLEDGTRYFDENYAMVTGTVQIGDQTYTFDQNGIMVEQDSAAATAASTDNGLAVGTPDIATSGVDED